MLKDRLLPEVSILGADQKDHGLWAREWALWHSQLHREPNEQTLLCADQLPKFFPE